MTNDKERIERLVNKHTEAFDCGEYCSRVDMMTGFLLDYIAERGKEAVAEVCKDVYEIVWRNCTPYPRGTRLFLAPQQPAIPEGMAPIGFISRRGLEAVRRGASPTIHATKGGKYDMPVYLENRASIPEGMALVPIEPTDSDIDRILSTRIPGGSSAADWFLPHDTERGLENVRTVVRLMIAAA